MNAIATVDIDIVITIDANAFWRAVNGSEWQVWGWWQGYRYSQGAAWDKLGEVEVTVENPTEEESLVRVLNVEALAKAFGELASAGYEMDWRDLDAENGDLIFQQAIFGEIVYS